jgi:hypothetical protein
MLCLMRDRSDTNAVRKDLVLKKVGGIVETQSVRAVAIPLTNTRKREEQSRCPVDIVEKALLG